MVVCNNYISEPMKKQLLQSKRGDLELEGYKPFTMI